MGCLLTQYVPMLILPTSPRADVRRYPCIKDDSVPFRIFVWFDPAQEEKSSPIGDLFGKFLQTAAQ